MTASRSVTSTAFVELGEPEVEQLSDCDWLAISTDLTTVQLDLTTRGPADRGLMGVEAGATITDQPAVDLSRGVALELGSPKSC